MQTVERLWRKAADKQLAPPGLQDNPAERSQPVTSTAADGQTPVSQTPLSP